jgi:hypothetical protein
MAREVDSNFLSTFRITTFSKLQVLSAQMFSVSAGRRAGVSI